MADATFDFTELRDLSFVLESAPARNEINAERVTKRAAQNIKRDAADSVREQMSAPGRTRIPHYPRSIDYDIESTSSGVEAEIGPNSSKKQGRLSVEYGSVNAPPMPHLIPAYEQELPKYLGSLAKGAENAILGAGVGFLGPDLADTE